MVYNRVSSCRKDRRARTVKSEVVTGERRKTVGCPCLEGGACQLPEPELKRLLKERNISNTWFDAAETMFLSIFSAKYRATARFNKKFPLWLREKARLCGAEHAVLEGFYQRGPGLDSYVRQDVTFICPGNRPVRPDIVILP